MVTAPDQDPEGNLEDLGARVEDPEVEAGDQEVKIGTEEDITEDLGLDQDQDHQ